MGSLECKVYVKELRPLGYGLPLFEPNPAGYDHVRIGDVGITDKDGSFMRIFNCFAQADHEVNARYGVPEGFEPLEDRCQLTKDRQALVPGHWYKSQHIHQIESSVDFSSTSAPAGIRASFNVSSQQGAAFFLKHKAERIDATRLISFKRYMLKHFESWEQFIRDMDFQFELQDIILVTGHDLTAKWATLTRVHRASGASLAITFSNFVGVAGASFSRSSESSLEIPVRIGPDPYNPSERHLLLQSDTLAAGSDEPFKDQCLFLRGYRVAKRPILPAKLRAAAGPGKLDMDGDDDTYADVVPIGSDSDEESQIDEDIVDHNFAMNLVFKHTNAEIAIINESDICYLAKAIGNHTEQLASRGREELRAIGLEIKAEFDSQVQKTVGTLKMSPLAVAASSSADPTVLPYKGSVADADTAHKGDGYTSQASSEKGEVVSLSNEKQPVTDNERVFGNDRSANPWVSKGKRKVTSASNIENPIEDENFYIAQFMDNLLHSSKGTTSQVWNNVTVRPSKTLSGHDSAVRAVAFSPDGSRIASGSTDKTIRLWDAVTGVQIRRLLCRHEDRVWSVAFSPDGNRIASGSSDKTIRLWDAVTGMQVGEPLRGHDDCVLSVAFSPDGSRIASGSRDRTIRLWDAVTGVQVGEPLRGHDDCIQSVVFSPDGSRIASGASDKTIRLWDAVTGMQVKDPLRGHDDWVLSVAFSPGGNRIASGSYDQTVRLWNTETGMQVGESLRGHNGPIYSVAFSPGGSRIASGSWDNAIRFWDAITGIQIGEPLCGHDDRVLSVAFSSDGKQIASGSFDKTVRIWEITEAFPTGLQ